VYNIVTVNIIICLLLLVQLSFFFVYCYIVAILLPLYGEIRFFNIDIKLSGWPVKPAVKL